MLFSPQKYWHCETKLWFNLQQVRHSDENFDNMALCCNSGTKFFDTSKQKTFAHHNIFDVVRKVCDYRHFVLGTVGQNCTSSPKLFDAMRQNCDYSQNILILWPKIVILAKSFAEVWDKLVIHLKYFSTPWNKFVIHLSIFSIRWDKFLMLLTGSLPLSNESVTVDTKFFILCIVFTHFYMWDKYLVHLTSFWTPLDKIVILAANVSAQWNKTLIRFTKISTVRDKILILATIFSALWGKNLNQLTKFSIILNDDVIRVSKFPTIHNQIIKLHITTFLTSWERLVITATVF